MILTTQSSWSAFKTCRKFYDFRYNRGLVRLDDDREALHLGKEWDRVLNAYYLGQSVDVLIQSCHYRATILPMWHAYVERWAIEDQGWEVVRMQVPFTGPIINPETGAASRTFQLGGVADGLWRRRSDGALWLNENKTTSRIDRDYLDRLWLDWQTSLYVAYLEPLVGPIAGVIWNLAEKPTIRRAKGETDAEFAERRAAYEAEGKNPNRLRQQVADTDESWSQKLHNHYAGRPEKFHREEILLDRADVAAARDELWDLAQSAMEAKRRGVWYRNTARCHHYGKACEYLCLCRSRENPVLIETQYRVEPPHGEVREAFADAAASAEQMP